MAKSMSQSTRDEYLEKRRCRYRRYTGKPAKSRLLDEFCELTGHERKFELKDWIEERLARIWKLDAALNLAQSEGKPARTSSLKPSNKPPTQKNATETPKAA
jgi:hypothetical protein